MAVCECGKMVWVCGDGVGVMEMVWVCGNVVGEMVWVK